MKRFVISDIHGCIKTFEALLNQLALSLEDQLYLLGDYIDRGPDSAGVIEKIIHLQKAGYQVFPLRGNHEENLLKAYAEYDAPTFFHYVKRINKSGNLLDKNGRVKESYLEFFKSLPYYTLLDDFVLVHAGVNLDIKEPFEDKTSMLELRGYKYPAEHDLFDKRRIVHGHVPNNIECIEEAVEKGKCVLPLDNGCVYTKPHKVYDYTKLGNLLCLELNSMQLIIQNNIDNE